MHSDAPVPIYLKDYKPTPFAISHVELDVRLHETRTVVKSTLSVVPRVSGEALTLHGEELELVRIAIDGVVLSAADYQVTDEQLTIYAPPARAFTLEILQACNPKENTRLSGLYLSNGMFCTQMEAEGFRRFAYFYDRPDVMATYRVRLEGPKALPILLSNGNPVESGDVPGTDSHFAVWEDPHPKPTYLFALVGGDLAGVHDSFTTMTGQSVQLGIYVEKGKEDRCGWAMECLKASMRWDETRFGRVYDLDVFNIVAVSDFNMGAMENKGLNIFNDKYVLALPETATDTDYVNIEAIIAHEYFHNWTGNRITCRDWFQLCVKEGLTVFRDQEFTSDLRSRAVKRIADVKTLRARQIPEDQGPLSHPVRPNSYIEINNFYTATVYEKGAELCRMLQTLIGPAGFRKAMDLYFERHDGDAVTVEDFIACMAETSGRDLTQFFAWYGQAGTPVVAVKGSYDASAQTYTVHVAQSCAATPGQREKVPLHMPLSLGLLAKDGSDILVDTPVIELTKAEQSWTFNGIAERPVLSINRGFTAPVSLLSSFSASDHLFLMGHDSDPFNRWDSAQVLGRELIVKSMAALSGGTKLPDAGGFADALERTLRSNALDDAFKAQMLALPPEAEIAASSGGNANSDVVHAAREHVRAGIATRILGCLTETHAGLGENGPYRPDTAGTSRRALRYTVLGLIAAGAPERALELAEEELARPGSMTAEIGALSAVLSIDDARRDAMLAQFYDRHCDDHLLLDKWFMLQAQIPGAESYKRIERLLAHKDFRMGTPNRVYALIGGFTAGCLSGFNAEHGEGYRVVADVIIELDGINPQAASRMATGFRSWAIFDEVRRDHARRQMERILAKPGLSRDVLEIVSRTVKS
jgi:aminopeptidase N